MLKHKCFFFLVYHYFYFQSWEWSSCENNPVYVNLFTYSASMFASECWSEIE